MTRAKRAIAGMVATLLGGAVLLGPFLTDQEATKWTVTVGGLLVVVGMYFVDKEGMTGLWTQARNGIPVLEDAPAQEGCDDPG